jgi:hypothetical protein
MKLLMKTEVCELVNYQQSAWLVVPMVFTHVATDANGDVWAYSDKPTAGDYGWADLTYGTRQMLGIMEFEDGDDWRDSLQEIFHPEVEGEVYD